MRVQPRHTFKSKSYLKRKRDEKTGWENRVGSKREMVEHSGQLLAEEPLLRDIQPGSSSLTNGL